MRLLIIPWSTVKNYEQDSMYLQIRDFAEWLVENSPEPVYFYWLLQRETAFRELQKANPLFWKYGKIIQYSEGSTDFHDSSYLLPGNTVYHNFNRRQGNYPVDAVLMFWPGTSVWVKRWLIDMRRRWMNPPVFVPNPQVMNFIHERFRTIHKYERFMHMVGYSDTYQFLLSTEERSQAIKGAREYMAGTMLRKIPELTKIVPMGIRTDIIDRLLAEDSEKYDKFTLFYGGRFNSVKNVVSIVAWFDDVFKAGHDVQIVMTTPNRMTKEFIAGDYPHFKFHWNQSREDYLRKAIKSHISICATEYESFGAAFFEQLYAGTVAIFPDKPWVKSVFQGMDYPFKFEDKQEAQTLIRYIKDNYEECLDQISWVRDFIKEKMRSDLVFTSYRDSIFEGVEAQDEAFKKANMGTSINKLIDDAADILGDEFTFADMEKALFSLSDTFKWPLFMRARAPSKWDVYRYLIARKGYIDTCTEEMPIFRKVVTL